MGINPWDELDPIRKDTPLKAEMHDWMFDEYEAGGCPVEGVDVSEYKKIRREFKAYAREEWTQDPAVEKYLKFIGFPTDGDPKGLGSPWFTPWSQEGEPRIPDLEEAVATGWTFEGLQKEFQECPKEMGDLWKVLVYVRLMINYGKVPRKKLTAREKMPKGHPFLPSDSESETDSEEEPDDSRSRSRRRHHSRSRRSQSSRKHSRRRGQRSGRRRGRSPSRRSKRHRSRSYSRKPSRASRRPSISKTHSWMDLSNKKSSGKKTKVRTLVRDVYLLPLVQH